MERMFSVKAVILAGGEGTRLRPVTLDRPKAMVSLFGRPVAEHLIRLLRHHGITDICMAIQYLPEPVKNWFGDGSELGVKLTYFQEEEPLGTAGCVKRCMSHLGDEDFLVVSGDIVCNLDLSAAVGFHRASRAAATLVLARHPRPLEYGLVLTDDSGRVRQFVEKPGWSQVVSGTVNTGIYVLTPRAMERVPEGRAFDFGQDLFPRLLEEGESLFGHVAEGYWRDIGDCESYLRCTCDALDQKIGIEPELPQRKPGIWAAEEPPTDVTLVPPCWIGPGAVLGAGSLIGPHAVLEAGASVGRRSLVQNSILLENTRVADRCTLYGAILCRGASVRSGAVLNEGSVLGSESVARENSVLLEGVRVWPRRRVAENLRLSVSLVSGSGSGAISFGDGGVIRGTLGDEITPELLLTIGGVLGAEGKVGLGYGGGECARMLSRCAGSGISAAGGEALVHDGSCPSAGAWAAGRYAMPVSLFVQQEGERIFLHFFDSRGLSLSLGRQRRLEWAVRRGELRRAPIWGVGAWEYLSGIPAAYAADAARLARYTRTPTTPVAVSVAGEGEADRVMAAALEELGCVVIRKQTAGVPAFAAEYGGLRLAAWNEDGEPVPPDQILALVSLIELENGGGRIALPQGAPEAIRTLAGDRHGEVLTLARDGKRAEELYVSLPWLRDAVFAAARICARLGQTGERLSVLTGKTPRFVVLRREIPLKKSRGEIMQALAGETGEQTEEGLRILNQESAVWLVPMSRRASLRVAVEAASAETAAELCDFYTRKIAQLDDG